MKRWLCIAGALPLVALAGGPAWAVEITLDNGLPTSDPNYYNVRLDENAYSDFSQINIPGYGLTDIIYHYNGVLQSGANVYSPNPEGLGNWTGGSWTDSDPSDGSISSQGTLGGINWSVTHSLPTGGNILTSAWTLSAAGDLPSLRFFQYLDEDVQDYWDDILLVRGSIAGGDLELVTVDPPTRAGISQAGDNQATGWAADVYPELLAAVETVGYNAAATGTIDTGDLPYHIDPYFGPAYGPADVTTAIEWEYQGGAERLTFEAYLGGIPEVDIIPEPATMALLGGGLLALLRRRNRRK